MEPVHGTLTIVFTDIEGSTDLAQRLGEKRWFELLAEHERSVGELVASHGGRLVKSMGDGFMMVFQSTRAGVRCALDIAELAAPFRVRAGVHVGEATFRGEDLGGSAVVRAARIAAAATGGEVLVSTLVQALASEDTPDLIWGQPIELELKGLPGTTVVQRVDRAQSDGQRALRVVIADDAVIVRDGLAALLRAGGLLVDDVTDHGDGLVEIFTRHRPDVVITDVRMPPGHRDEGLSAAERIRELDPRAGILVLSQHADIALGARLLATSEEAGSGYLLKDRVTNLDLLITAVRTIYAGGIVLDAELVERMIKRRPAPLASLSDEERALFSLVAQGRPVSALAAKLALPEAQVAEDIEALFAALDLPLPPTEQHQARPLLALLATPARPPAPL